MAKITLSDVGNFNSNALSIMIANNDAIEAALENTISRNGASPNQMQADLDLNGNDLLNVSTLQVTSLDVDTLVIDDVAWNIPDIAAEVEADRLAADASASTALASANSASASAALAVVSKMTWRGDYSGATAYVTSDVVHDQLSTWIALQSTTGNPPPTLPTTSNTYWELVALKGDSPWAPVFAVVNDGDRRVLQVTDWTGGSGTEPASGSYLGASGYVVDIGDATDIRGLEGSDGLAATLTLGTITTGAPGSSVIITNVGTTSAAILDITIPRGATGAAGAGTGDMLASSYDPAAKGVNVYNVDNHDESATRKIMTAAERTIVADAAVKASTNDFTATQNFKSTVDATITQRHEITAAAGTTGPRIDFVLLNTTPANGHSLGGTRYLAKNSAGTETNYGSLSGQIIDPTAGSEDSQILMATRIAGALSGQFYVGNGAYMLGATGGYQGSGTINATAFYTNGVELDLPPVRSSRTDAISNFHPKTAPDFLVTAGYATAGDGGASLYKKVGSEPSHPGKLSITTYAAATVWYELTSTDGWINPCQLGCVADGAMSIDDPLEGMPTGTGAMSGTDSYQGMRDTYTVAAALTGGRIWLPGFFYIAVPDDADGYENMIEVENIHMEGASAETCGIYFGSTHDNATLNVGSAMIGPATRYPLSVSEYSRTLYDYFFLKNITLRGSWWYDVEQNNRTWTGSNVYRLHGPCPHNYRHARIEGCRIWDVLGFGVYGKSCLKAEYIDNDVRRVCGDGLRGEDTSDYTVRGNRIENCDDDSITNPPTDEISNLLSPRRERALITGNTLVNCEGMHILAPANCIITNNKLSRCYGASITVLTTEADGSDAGEGGFRSVIVSGNVVEDQLKSSTRTDPPSALWNTSVHAAIVIDGSSSEAITTTYPLGENITSDANYPWYSGDVPWGALRLHDQSGGPSTAAGEASGYRGYGVVVTNNIVARTLPNATNYSDWSYGERFTRYGFDDPVVADTNFANHGLFFRGQFDGAVVANNQAHGFIEGSGIFLEGLQTDMAYKSFLITGNTIKNVHDGIGNSAASTKYQDITISNNIIDVDPYRVQSERDKTVGDHGKWTDVTATAPACVDLTHIRGVKLLNNVFMNAANPWTLEGGVIEVIQYNTIRGNIGVVDFVNGTALSTTDSNNRGLGRIHRAGQMITYDIRDLNPANYGSTYGQPRAGMIQVSSAMPTSGYYVIGHKVDRAAGGYWYRLTTGTAHILGTDWVLVS